MCYTTTPYWNGFILCYDLWLTFFEAYVLPSQLEQIKKWQKVQLLGKEKIKALHEIPNKPYHKLPVNGAWFAKMQF
jgi:hypothetical protein